MSTTVVPVHANTMRIIISLLGVTPHFVSKYLNHFGLVILIYPFSDENIGVSTATIVAV